MRTIRLPGGTSQDCSIVCERILNDGMPQRRLADRPFRRPSCPRRFPRLPLRAHQRRNGERHFRKIVPTRRPVRKPGGPPLDG